MNYRIIDKETYYRKGVYLHFTRDCKCSTSMTARIDVTALAAYSKQTGTRFYLNFLYVLSKVLNSRDDYRMAYLWQTDELICYDVVHPTQYVFHEDTETCTPVYTEFREDYDAFYRHALEDVERAKQTREYGLEAANHPNWFDASYISWLSYDALNIELPDGYLYFLPIINWGKISQGKRKIAYACQRQDESRGRRRIPDCQRVSPFGKGNVGFREEGISVDRFLASAVTIRKIDVLL